MATPSKCSACCCCCCCCCYLTTIVAVVVVVFCWDTAAKYANYCACTKLALHTHTHVARVCVAAVAVVVFAAILCCSLRRIALLLLTLLLLLLLQLQLLLFLSSWSLAPSRVFTIFGPHLCLNTIRDSFALLQLLLLPLPPHCTHLLLPPPPPPATLLPAAPTCCPTRELSLGCASSGGSTQFAAVKKTLLFTFSSRSLLSTSLLQLLFVLYSFLFSL